MEDAFVKGNEKTKREDLVAPEIFLDLMIEILTRLPAKSLMMFKCVSKLWFSLIRSRYFTNLYHTVASPPRLYMSLMEHLKCDSMEVCHNPGKSPLLSFSLPSCNNAKSLDQDLTMPGIGGDSMVILRGLILYRVCRKACIYNPTTRQNITLPPVKSNIFAQKGFEKFVNYFLGHDPILDQYKVVCVVAISSKDAETVLTSEYWVLVLEAGGSWKRIEFNQHHVPTELGLCINGVIYYFAAACLPGDIAVCYVVSFDVRSEEFSMIQAPHDVILLPTFVGFIEYGGRPAILDHTDLVQKGLVELWVVENCGKWSKKSLVLHPCQMHLVDNSISFNVEGTTRNGEVILSPFDFLSTCYILYYDLQKNDLRKINIRDIRDQTHEFSEFFYFNLTLMDKSESIMHLET